MARLRRRRVLAEPLEPRILLSADLPGVLPEIALPQTVDPPESTDLASPSRERAS